MHLRALIAAALLTIAAPVALAALPPEYYEQARREAASVIVLRVQQVNGPGFGKAFGDCAVSGRIVAVERGSTYEVGDRARLRVPCRRANTEVPASGTLYQDLPTLRRAHWGRAWLTPDGEIALSQYEQLSSYP